MASCPRFDHGLLHGFLAEEAAHAPASIAIEIPPGQGRADRQALTYGELAALSDRLAMHLAAQVQPEQIVALLLPRTSPLLFIAQIAVLKAGGAYTALDPSFPDERIAEVLEDAEAVCVLTDAPGAARLGADTQSRHAC